MSTGTLGASARRSLTTGDLAVGLDCSRNTAIRLADRGLLPSFRLTPTSPRRFSAGDLLDFVAERTLASRPSQEDT